MRLFILFFIPCFSFGQLQDVELCKNVFQKDQIDSTYKHFYIAYKDTTYFSNDRCVMFPQPTSPVATILFMIDGGSAKGIYRFEFQFENHKTVIDGSFKQGYLYDGKWKRYFLNGKLKSSSIYSAGTPFGTHIINDESGNLIHQCEKVNGLCPPKVTRKEKH